MFNHAKRIPRKMQQEHALHRQRMALGREQSLQEDAKSLAILMSQQGKNDPEEVMGQVQYWQYVDKFDHEYYEDVRKLTQDLIPNIERILPAVPQKQPQGGGAGGMGAPPPPPGGAMAPMVASGRGAKVAFMYLKRDDGGEHKLMGGFASGIIMGQQQYPNEHGVPFCLRISHDGNLSVSASSPSALEAKRIQDDLPDEIVKALVRFLSGRVANPEEVAQAAFRRYRKNKNLDLVPVSLAISGASKAILMLLQVKGVVEPEEVSELRKEIGKVMFPYVSRLKKALAKDGIKFREIRSPLPAFVASQEEDGERPSDRPAPASALRPLDDGEIETSLDFRSLLMTAARGNVDAARRLAFAMARYPVIARASGICGEDVSLPQAGEYGKAACAMLRLVNGDDADLMAAYMDGDDFLRMCISFLVVAQDRSDILRAAPGMCVTDDQLNIEFFSRLDASDRIAADVIEGVAKAELACPSKILGRKLMEVALHDPGRVELCCLCQDSCPYAIAVALEGGDSETARSLMASNVPVDSDAWAIVASMGSGVRIVPTSPLRISNLLGRPAALEYMCEARVDWDGDRIPRAPDIVSLPINPVPLARNLAVIGDVAGMLMLLHRCVESKKLTRAIKGAAKVLVRELSRLGHEREAHAMLASSRMSITDVASSSDSINVMIIGGDTAGAAVAMCDMFDRDPQEAVSVLEQISEPPDPKLFADMLPTELISMANVPWLSSRDRTAMALPYGFVATGRCGTYQVGNRAFAASEEDAFAAAALVLAQGLGVLRDETIGRQVQRGQEHANTAQRKG